MLPREKSLLLAKWTLPYNTKEIEESVRHINN